jgi:hypothetical protein
VGHQGIDFLQTHPLLDGPFHADQTNSVLVFQQFADGATRRLPRWSMSSTTPWVSRKFNQGFGGKQDVLFPKNPDDSTVTCSIPRRRLIFKAPDAGQIIVRGLEEKVVKKILGDFWRCRVAGTKQPVNLDQRLLLGGHLVQQQRFSDGIATGCAINKQQFKILRMPCVSSKLFNMLSSTTSLACGDQVAPVFGSATEKAIALSEQIFPFNGNFRGKTDVAFICLRARWVNMRPFLTIAHLLFSGSYTSLLARVPFSTVQALNIPVICACLRSDDLFGVVKIAEKIFALNSQRL